MANELTITLNMSYNKPPSSASFNSGTQQYTVVGSDFIRSSMTVPTSATAIPLGSVAVAGYVMIMNRDAVNYVDVYTAVAGTMFARLQPGYVALIPFGATAPAVQAHTASCKIDYLLISQ